MTLNEYQIAIGWSLFQHCEFFHALLQYEYFLQPLPIHLWGFSGQFS
jgi:hypothetical protein